MSIPTPPDAKPTGPLGPVVRRVKAESVPVDEGVWTTRPDGYRVLKDRDGNPKAVKPPIMDAFKGGPAP